MVEAFSANGSDQSFNERMRERNERYRFDFRHTQDSQVRLPLMESIQRIMIRTEIFRNWLPSNRSIEHATEYPSVDDASMNSESNDDPTVLIHNHRRPVRPQDHRFTSEQINAVKAIFRVTDEGEPGRSRCRLQTDGSTAARIRRTTSLLIEMPKAKAICLAIRGHPHCGFR